MPRRKRREYTPEQEADAIRLVRETRNPRLVQERFGRRSLETTISYLEVLVQEERAEAQAMWR